MARRFSSHEHPRNADGTFRRKRNPENPRRKRHVAKHRAHRRRR